MTKQQQQTIAITGSNGFIGQHLVSYFAHRGWAVRCLQRKPASIEHPNVTFHPFSLPDQIDETTLAGADVLVHAAVQYYSVKHKNADSVNRQGTQNLLEACRKQGVKFIFLSTLSAHEAAESHYGRNKFELEKIFDPETDLVLRLGLELANGGLFTNMVEIIRKSKIVPLIAGGKQPIQTIAMDDLCRIIEIAIKQNFCGTFNIAEPTVKTMKFLYEEIVKRLGLKRYFVPLPLWLLLTGVSFLEKLNIPFGITSENVLGLKQMRAFETRHDMAKFGVSLQSTEQAVSALLTP